MTTSTTRPTPPRSTARPPAARPRAGGQGNGPNAGSTLAMPSAAALASICASTAISGVVGGLNWLSYVVVVVLVVAGTGVALRALRVPRPLIWLGEMFVLLCLTVTLFTNSGLLVVLPGPAALHDLGVVFGQAGQEVQNGVPPVTADQPILCLVVLSIGMVAVAVDTLAVTAKVPAAAGLILLCVYAVPASLDDVMLPWWSFVLGAASFTVMLAVDGVQRHQAWRGKLGLPAVATTGVAPATIAVTAVAAVFALFIGATFTIVGTVGRLPGANGDGTGGTGALGIKPFTVLQGMLNEKGTSEMFDVTGLPRNAPYLQAVTLDTYDPGQGWVTSTRMSAGVAADGALPEAPGQQSSDPTAKVTINPVSWSDVWLPVFGMPTRLQNVSPDYRYDTTSGIVYSIHPHQPSTYTETADLTEPTATALRTAGEDYSGVEQKYMKISGVNPRVSDLARQITANATDEFDAAQDIYAYFHNPTNGFTYSTQTAKPHVSDPLVDFLFYGKTGYCEQYASAMGVMLRSLGIPTRVGIGFTDGFSSDGHQTITSQDAHAWDEVYFPGYGWVTFDPTPLTDGRTQVPGYLNTPQNNGGSGNNARVKPDAGTGHTTPTTTPATPNAPAVSASATPAGGGWSGPPIWELCVVVLLALVAAAATVTARRAGPRVRRWRGVAAAGWGLLVFFVAALLSWWLAALVIVLAIAASPALVREARRRRHHRTVAARGPGAADAAWSELLAESWDRGTDIPPSDTLRIAAHRMVREHGLDRQGQESLRTLVGEVERSWYAPQATTTVSTTVVESFDQVRDSMHRNAPLAWRSKLLPRSVLRPARKRPQDDEDDNPAED